jgi:hypothetical protein
MASPNGIITLISDFGTRDYYVGAMKGACLQINPSANLVDVTHEIPAGNIRYAAYVLAHTWPRFPAGTVHLVVVDPGVGGRRRPIALAGPSGIFVGPDNGVFTTVLDEGGVDTIVEVTEQRFFSREISRTFHGRDVFGPVAARLSSGAITVEDLGAAIDDPVRLDAIAPERIDDVLIGCVIHCDHFGNLVSNVSEEVLENFLDGGTAVVEVGGVTIEGLSDTYIRVAEGQPLALIGSSGLLEISINRGSAGELLGISIGERVVVRRSARDGSAA